MTAIDTTPYWEISGAPRFAPLSRSLSVDVAVIGGGLTGVTAAYLLKAAGLSVALVERGRCGQGETSHTTAHLTAVTDAPFPNLVRSFGAEHAQAVWDAGFAALAQIDANVRRERIDCEFRWLPGSHGSARSRRGQRRVGGVGDPPARIRPAGADRRLRRGLP